MTYIPGLHRSLIYTKEAAKVRRKFNSQLEETNTYGEIIRVGYEPPPPSTDELPDDKGDIG